MASKESVFNYGAVARDTIPSNPKDTGQEAVRMDGYGGQYTQQQLPGLHALMLEGSLFSFRHATFDAATNLAGHAAPVLADIDDTLTKAFVFLRNKAPSSDKRRLHVLRLSIYVVTAGANGTNSMFAYELEKNSATRYSAGGGDLTVMNCNPQSTNSLTDVLTAKGGAVTVTAEVNAVKLDRGKARPSIEVAGDERHFIFGADNPSHTAAAAAAAVRVWTHHGPAISLGPSDSFIFGQAGVAQDTAGVYEVRGLLAYR